MLRIKQVGKPRTQGRIYGITRTRTTLQNHLTLSHIGSGPTGTKKGQRNAMDKAEVQKKLSAPIQAGDVDYKIQTLNKDGQSALITWYIDARTVIERLNEAAPLEWHDEYTIIESTPEKMVVQCALTVLDITRHDVGESDNSPNEASRHKSAYS